MKSVSNPKSLAILGGTFDPVHIGHLRIALQLRQLGFAAVWLMPNATPPHRPQPQAMAEQRLAMLRLATQSLDGIEVCDLELLRDAPSYSADTLTLLRQQYADCAMTWVMGTDAWNSFDQWQKPEVILECANVLVISRPGDKIKAMGWQHQQAVLRRAESRGLRDSHHGAIAFQAWPELDISASDLRQAIKQGDNVTFLTPDAVLEYINQHKLYR